MAAASLTKIDNSIKHNFLIKSPPPIKLNRNSIYGCNDVAKAETHEVVSTVTADNKSVLTSSVEESSTDGKLSRCLRLRRYNISKKYLVPRSVELNAILNTYGIKSSVGSPSPDVSDSSAVSINSDNIKTLMSCIDNELKSKDDEAKKKRFSSKHDDIKVDDDLSKIITSESNELNGSSEVKEVYQLEPMFSGHQLVGDSQLLRFSQYILGMQRKIDINGKGWLGLCVGGQRICDLHKRVLEGIIPLAKKLVVLIGTNDLLKGTSSSEMCKGLHNLLMTLFKTAEKIVLLTLPPVPKIAYLSEHWQKLKKYNDFIFSLKDHYKDKLSIADISPLFYQSKLKKCHLGYYELWFEGPIKRPDLIHINESGFKLIRDVLLKEMSVMYIYQHKVIKFYLWTKYMHTIQRHQLTNRVGLGVITSCVLVQDCPGTHSLYMYIQNQINLWI
ncbi:uncharacterized protein LOC142331749 isoform X2 [Lycorma delicatula]|uniref:uncharacterized protein LOC142331749 isoform X2 n=1 Tax=Lycorma delicatula TaxID=130591 RepID=UPI003F514DC6